jgi:hypothetical protein
MELAALVGLLLSTLLIGEILSSSGKLSPDEPGIFFVDLQGYIIIPNYYATFKGIKLFNYSFISISSASGSESEPESFCGGSL